MTRPIARRYFTEGVGTEFFRFLSFLPMQNKFEEVLVVLLRALLGFHNLGVYLGLVGGLPPVVGCLDVLSVLLVSVYYY
jgi:uncharacterized membrane protein